jgi:hypothetical protein
MPHHSLLDPSNEQEAAFRRGLVKFGPRFSNCCWVPQNEQKVAIRTGLKIWDEDFQK